MDYKKTLNLPKTSFPMRANLAKREPDFLKYWEKADVYGKLMERSDQEKRFILHDGPPYANGNIHIGTAFNKILKDFIPKYKWMRGMYSPYVPGWDTHGLPIELRVLKEENLDREQLDSVDLRQRCRAYAEKFIDVQRSEFKRLGVMGDWDNPYVTFKPSYEAAQIGAFADMVEKGLVYKGHKPVFWCVDCQTALAAAEIEYEDEASPSIYVSYPLTDGGDRFDVLKGKALSVVIWTTTPWTLPASMAVALHPDYSYVFVPDGQGRVFLFAQDLLQEVAKATGLEFGEPLLVLKGKELEGLSAAHPFYEERRVPLVLADYVTLESGTGCVHTAPGHGVEDFETGVRYGIEVYNPVDDAGVFLPETPLVGGLSLDEGAKKVLATLTGSGRLLGSGKIKHSYPHCWRCKKPVIFRATEQWFVSVDKFRQKALDVIANNVQWIPDWGQDRISNMVRDRSDWCISRQRTWGVPIPAFYCEDCGELVLDPERIRRIQARILEHGSDIWWSDSVDALLGDLGVCPHCGSKHLRKEKDIMDVWFDSGVSHFSVLETRDELSWPADLYLEGSDQHRGWFQTSLLTSVANREVAPYKAVLTHGFIVDGEGRKMSKSIGNVIAPQEIIDKYGADILRLWVASTDYRNDIRISQTIIKNLTESYRRIRNTARFLLGNLNGFDPAISSVRSEDMPEMDRWILSRLQGIVEKATRGFDDYEFHIPTFAVHQFCVNELSSFYLDVSKDRLYAEESDSLGRRSCQTVMWRLLSALTRILAPILSFTSEEIWQQMKTFDTALPESVFQASWPDKDPALVDFDLERKWGRVLEVRSVVSRALELARSAGVIGHSLEATVEVAAEGEAHVTMALLDQEMWTSVCIVSSFSVVEGSLSGEGLFTDEETGLMLRVTKATGGKCPRCWKYTSESEGGVLCDRCRSVLEAEGIAEGSEES